MRDLQHWKDKVELSLDGRQVFFLFFGGAVLACLLFALGVMTGRRLEARAIALETPATEDPLAALDELGNLEDEELSYHRALTKDPRAAHAPAAKAVTPTVPVTKPTLPTPATKPPVSASKAAHASASMPDDADTDVKLPAPPPVTPASNTTKPAAKKPLVADKSDKDQPTAGHFTLQLSAFAARKDADDLASRVRSAGYKPFVVASEVAGKGTVYRVRLGDYANKDLAIAEKSSVESKLKATTLLVKM
jgi:cell division septation protein DedD